MDNAGIEITDLSFSYPEYPGLPARSLLDGVDLSVSEGEIGLVLGASDEGKTTLARILGGLVPRFTGGTIGGSVRASGADVRRIPPYDLLERVGLVFQHPDEQIVGTRCDTEVAFALESLGTDRSVMEPRVRDALALFGLSGFEARNPATLSGGEKKRLLLACLGAVDPGVWVLDEAFEELDLSWRLTALDLLRKKGRTALVLDSRWAPVFEGRVDRHAVLSCGSVHGLAADPGSPVLRAAMDASGILPPSRRVATPPGITPAPYLRARGLSFAFTGTDSFSLEVEGLELQRGAVTALVGPNGSGKSTLARLLCGLYEPARGTIEVDRGGGFAPAAAADLNRLVGYLFQDPDHQIFLPTVHDELALSLRASGTRGIDAERRIGEATERFGLPPGGTPPALMSYGSRKLLQAAACWLLGRDLLILDEADSGLSYRRFLALLAELRAGGAGIMLVTHDAALARAAADRVLALDGGRIVADAGPGRFDAALAVGGLTAGGGAS
ncbi:MAG: ABC transporter ATP-binding protein [Spirochaetes bacterium]|nr:ABC transporter ATP-binding protein [Spirochaetota bacterium]